MGADKKDVVFECVRQLTDVETYLKLSEEELKIIIPEIQSKLIFVIKAGYTGTFFVF